MGKWLRNWYPAVILGVLAFGCFGLKLSVHVAQTFEDAKARVAEKQISHIEWACGRYMADHGGRPPDSLEVLVTSADAKPPVIEGGPNALLDPWGKPYQYDPANLDRHGNPDPLVWTPDPDGLPVFSPKRKPEPTH